MAKKPTKTQLTKQELAAHAAHEAGPAPGTHESDLAKLKTLLDNISRAADLTDHRTVQGLTGQVGRAHETARGVLTRYRPDPAKTDN